MASLPFSKSRRRASATPPVVTLVELDSRLDVPVGQWEKRVAQVVRDLHRRGAVLEIPQSPILASFQTAAGSWVNLFEHQVKSLEKMDRADEFRMARRYDFQKARVRHALSRVGYAKDSLGELQLRPMHALPPAPKKANAADLVHLEQTIEELAALRNAYVEGALYLIFAPVRRYRDLGVDEFDLIQEGAASLFQAIDGFDWKREVRFKTYAVYWIQQAILKTLYNASRTVRIPIWVQKAFRKIRRAQERAITEGGSVPTNADVAKELGIPVERVEEILNVRRYAVSIDAQLGDEEGSSLAASIADDAIEPIYDTIREGDLGEELRSLLGRLPDRERLILERRFGLSGGEPETLAEIAADLGVTAERIRQLQKAAIERLQGPDAMDRLRLFA